MFRRGPSDEEIARWVKAVADSGNVFAGGPNGMVSDAPQMNHARTQEKYFTSWVYSAIRPIASRIAAQPIRVARRARKPRTGKRVPKHLVPTWLKELGGDGLEMMDSHRIIDAIDKPNKAMVRWSLLFDTVVSLELTGRAFWLLDEEDSFETWPIPSSWIEPKHTHGLFSSYVIRPRNMGAVTETEVPAESMVRFYYPDPANPVLGSLSPLQAAARAVVTDDSIQECQRRLFSNGIFPGYAVIAGRHPDAVTGAKGLRPMLTAEQRQQIITPIMKAYRGAIQFGQPIILDALIEDIKKITNTPAEMDFMDSGKQTKARIFQTFGVNPLIAGEIEGANRAQAVVAEESFLTNTVNPKIELISQWLCKFMPERFGDPDVLVWIEPCRPHDPEQTRAEAEQLARHGAITKDEFRHVFNYPPLATLGIEGGDELITKPQPQLGNALIPASFRVRTKAHKLDIWLKQHTKGEAAFRAAMVEFFKKQAKQILTELRKVGPEAGVDQIFRPSEWDAELKAVAEKQIEKLATRGAQQEMQWFGGKAANVQTKAPRERVQLPREVSASVQSFVQRTMKQEWWNDINKNVRDDIERALKQGITEGESGYQIAKRVEEALGEDDSRARADRIARTETGAALNAGHAVTRSRLAEQGLIVGKTWQALVGDPDTRPDHEEAHDQKVGVDDPFKVGGEEAEYPGDMSLSPEQRANCRCLALSVPVSDEEEGE